ncbi:hypothetical protein IM538_13840 [Cytobacillus suaedae]|nr:hypothetical protein IM538_13840 [Cytobacillus suaedae]
MKTKNTLCKFVLLGFFYLLIFLSGCSRQDVYTEENCTNVFIPCVNASVVDHKVKVLNGGSSLLIGGRREETLGDSNSLDKNAPILKASRNDVVTLEFINKTPLSLNVYDRNNMKIKVDNFSFNLPNEAGI